MFHIHVDAKKISKRLMNSLVSQGFVRDDFSDLDVARFPNAQMITPVVHLTYKSTDRRDTKRTWQEAMSLCGRYPDDLCGYMEAECVYSKKYFSCGKPLAIPDAPFRLSKRQLFDSEPFKQAELHLVIDDDGADPRLVESFIGAGMYLAHMSNEGRPRTILTAQSTKKIIRNIKSLLETHLSQCGGYRNARLVDERIFRYALFGFEKEMLASVVDQVSITS